MAEASADQQESTQPLPSSLADYSSTSTSLEKGNDSVSMGDGEELWQRSREFPTLALTPAQFAMIKTLDECGFRRYLVHITKTNHSHAAIIVRTSRSSFDEGKMVIDHWLKENFKI